MAETVAEEWFRRVWNEGDENAIDELFARRGVAYGIHGDVIRGPDEFRAFYAVFNSVFSGIRIEVVEEIGCGQSVAVRVRARLRHRATNKRLTLLGTGFLEIRSGQIVKARNHWDFLSLLEGMDLLPERSFEMAISGALKPHPQVTSKAKVTKKKVAKRTKKRTRGEATA